MDVVTVSEYLAAMNLLEEAGGFAYLGMLARETPSVANIRAYAHIVRKRSLLRRLIEIAGQIADSAYNPEGREPGELVEQAERAIFEIAERGKRSSQNFVSIRQLLTSAVDRIDSLFHSDSALTGLSTGLTEFDSKTAGLQNGDLIIIAGRPSMGKTSFAMNIAEHVAIRDKVPTAVFSMEMPGSNSPCA